MTRKKDGSEGAAVDNLVLAHLRELRKAVDNVDAKVDRLANEVAERFDAVDSRLDSQKRALQGESIVGRYAVVDVEERLTALEKDVAGLKKRKP